MASQPNTDNEMMSDIELQDYMNDIQKAVDEWTTSFKDYDINDYMYEAQESTVYGIMEKYYSRIRVYQNRIPKQWKIKGLPTLRSLINDWMYEDSDAHLSDYEFGILKPMQDMLIKYKEQQTI
jgi:hypothetical protein